MLSYKISLPTKPIVKSEDGNKGVYKIEGLYPGFGHTLGNSLRRVMLSSIPGTAVTSIKIDGASHEFSTIDGVKEDVLTIILNLKRTVIKLDSEEEQEFTINVKGEGTIKASDITVPGQAEIVNLDNHILTSTDKKVDFNIRFVARKGLGYVSKEDLSKDKLAAGTMVLDSSFTPVRRASYEVDNMRVGDRTDFNKITFSIETDGTIKPADVLQDSIRIMLEQLKSVIGFSEEDIDISRPEEIVNESEAEENRLPIESMQFSTRTLNSLEGAGVKDSIELSEKTESEVLAFDGLGQKGLDEIKDSLTKLGLNLR